MRLTLRLSPSLMKEINEKLHIELLGETIEDCLRYGVNLYPELKELIWLEQKRLNPQLLFFHNNDQVREHDFRNPVQANDVLDLIPAIEGG